MAELKENSSLKPLSLLSVCFFVLCCRHHCCRKQRICWNEMEHFYKYSYLCANKRKKIERCSVSRCWEAVPQPDRKSWFIPAFHQLLHFIRRHFCLCMTYLTTKVRGTWSHSMLHLWQKPGNPCFHLIWKYHIFNTIQILCFMPDPQ